MSLIKSTHGPNWEKKNNWTGPIIRDSRVAEFHDYYSNLFGRVIQFKQNLSGKKYSIQLLSSTISTISL